MRHASLFTGFGGFDYAASQIGWENVFQVENNEYCNKILALRFKNTKRYLDIKEFSGKEYYGKIDIISGGFPCQPFSVAGEQRGKEDDRYLWPEMLRVVSEIRPAWVVGENVAGIGSILPTTNGGKQCKDYKPRNGVSGCCKHHRGTYSGTGVFKTIYNTNGVKDEKIN